MSDPQTDSNPTISTSNSIGIGHYKGVMLCNRPFAGSADIVSSNDNRSSPFACGVVHELPGLNVSILNKEKIKVNRVKKDSVLSKHRKWLIELQQTKDRLEKQYLDELEEKQKQHEKFTKQAHLNRMKTLAGESKTLNDSSNQKQTDKDNENINTSNDAKLAPQSDIETFESDSKDDNSSVNNNNGAKKIAKSKPAWALTEKLAEKKADLENENDLDQLLEYVNDLDYEKYIDEIEVSSAIDQIKQKIAALEKELVEEDKKSSSESNDSELLEKKTLLKQLNSTLSSLTTEKLSQNQMNSNENKGEDDRDKETRAKAKEILGQDQTVHSDRSVAAMLKVRVNKDDEAQPKILNEPKIVTHEPNEGLRLDPFKSTMSNLPYLHRNPAI